MELTKKIIYYCTFFSIFSGVLFFMKYFVSEKQAIYENNKREINELSESLHILNAEWAALNDPATLKKLSDKYLKLKQIKGEQLISYDDLQNSDFGEYDRKELNRILKNNNDVWPSNKAGGK